MAKKLLVLALISFVVYGTTARLGCDCLVKDMAQVSQVTVHSCCSKAESTANSCHETTGSISKTHESCCNFTATQAIITGYEPVSTPSSRISVKLLPPLEVVTETDASPDALADIAFKTRSSITGLGTTKTYLFKQVWLA